VYVPKLVQRIQTANAQKQGININLKAFAVGNGLMSDQLNDDSLMFFANYHGLFSQNLWNKMRTSCCTKPGDDYSCNFHNPPTASSCFLEVEAGIEIVYNSGLNYYDLYRDCYSSSDPRQQRIVDQLFRHYKANMGSRRRKERVGEDVPCIDSQGITNYLTRVDVQTAIHVKQGLPTWSICSDVLHYNRTDDNVQPLYPTLLTDYRALIYNGDTDMACNFIGDEWGVDQLARQMLEARRTWHVQGQVAGFVENYLNITYLTVKGAGHMVPQWKPVQALQMFQSFINNTPY